MEQLYILLRNNKTSAPCDLDELLGCGLRTTDLVWIEGKSAAWTSPGQVAELASCVETVELNCNDSISKVEDGVELKTKYCRSLDDIRADYNTWMATKKPAHRPYQFLFKMSSIPVIVLLAAFLFFLFIKPSYHETPSAHTARLTHDKEMKMESAAIQLP